MDGYESILKLLNSYCGTTESDSLLSPVDEVIR
ncbi:MAG: hypothetical protein KatS3mg045_2075 [Bellilinea sp.]|jgi:hypothetical protein|nr:MAG: hypothetical protein KatS3mg045_2075 [Bellilinea sp.]